ncbi:MAG: hypothetical protein KGL77_04305 [Actinomycetales bacterium]|nr:hypothetical protein [Actinomycetales bacterium]
MNTSTNEIRTSTMRLLLVTTGVFFTSSFFAVVATYPSFFLMNPFENPNPVRATMLCALVVAWTTLAISPVVLFGYFAVGHNWPMKVLPFATLLWPAMLLINHASLAIFEGNWYFGYLLDYPIFFVTDILMPAFLLAIWIELRPHNHPIRYAVARHRAN